MVEAGALERHGHGRAGERTERCEDARARTTTCPPSYWLTDKKNGGAFGFATEIGPGAAVPPLESLKQMLPARSLLADERLLDASTPAATSSRTSSCFTGALEAAMARPDGVEDYARKAQALAYEGQRAMFEALRRQQLHVDRRDPVDAQQRLAVDDLAPLRLLPAAGRRLLRHEEGVRAASRPVSLRRPLGRRRERPAATA